MNPVVSVQNLSYSYDDEEKALDAVSFDVYPGEFVGVIGPNKAGKSTLCQALVGLVPHFFRGEMTGRVVVGGIDTRDTTVDELSKVVGLVFQNPFTQVTGAKLTVYEEIAFGLENIGLPRKEIIGRVDQMLSLFRLEHVKHHNPFELSGGQMQRMAIASIIALRPRIVVLDEPTSQLDPQGSDEVFQAVSTLRSQGLTVIMVEHKIEKIARYADKVLLMNKGMVVAYDRPEAVFSRDDLAGLGVRPPVYTSVAYGLGLRRPDGTLPVAMDEVVTLIRGEATNGAPGAPKRHMSKAATTGEDPLVADGTKDGES